MKIITDISKIELEHLKVYLEGHPNYNYFQSVDAYYFYNSLDNYTPLIIICIENNNIVGSLLGIVTKEGSGPLGLLSRRCIIFGGPLVKEDRNDVAYAILKSFNSLASTRAIYSQFRNLHDMSNIQDAFQKNGWIYEDHLNIHVDLAQSEDTLWKEVHSKRRNEIRRAKKQGTTFAVSGLKEDIKPTYDILREVYGRAKLPLPALSYFEKAFDIFGPRHFKIFKAIYKDKIIGTLYALCFKKTIYDWYAGSYQEYYNKYPNDLIPWEVFLWGKANGYIRFDFGGAGKPGVPYGVRDYKKKFGGIFVNFGRYEKIHKPLLFKAASFGFKLYQKLK